MKKTAIAAAWIGAALVILLAIGVLAGALFTNDATGHGLRVQGNDSLPPLEASGF